MSSKSHFFRQSKGSFIPFSYYKFENNGNDSVGTNHGTVTGGVSYVNDANLAGLSMETLFGADYMDIPDSGDFSFTDGAGNDTACTIAFSYKCNKTTQQWFVNKRSDLGSNQEWWCLHNGSQFYFAFHDNTTGGQINVKYVTPLVIGNYYHIVITYNGSGVQGGITMYVNGIDVSTRGIIGAYNGMSNTTAPVRVAQTGWDIAGNNMVGLIDSLAFYNTEATPSQATDIYNKLINKIELA